MSPYIQQAWLKNTQEKGAWQQQQMIKLQQTINKGELDKNQTQLYWQNIEAYEHKTLTAATVGSNAIWWGGEEAKTYGGYKRITNYKEGEATYYEPTARELLIQKNRERAAVLRMNIARRRALRLLLAQLTADQQQEWEKEQAFHVETADGRRRYRIRRGMHGNITLVKSDDPAVKGKRGQAIKEGAVFCWCVAHPDGRLPEEDNVLAQKLMLESPEGEHQFLLQANVS